jgi:aspartyl protease family protein
MRDGNFQLIDLNFLCANGNSQTNVSSPVSSGSFRIPIKRREGNIPVVEVVFNGKQRFEMLFDTGATETVLTTQMAEAVKLKIDQTVPIATAGGIIQSSRGEVASVQVGGLVKRNLKVNVAPGVPMGLLGQNFYGNHDVTIREKLIELHVRKSSK